MSHSVKRNLPLLKILVKSSPQQRRAILCVATDDLVSAIAEIALNTLRGNIPLKPSQANILKRKRNIVKQLSNKKISLKKKRIIKQSGGFIVPLLSFAIPLLSGLFAK